MSAPTSLPSEGWQAPIGIHRYLKDIKPMMGDVKELYAFSALTSASEKGTGKVWRRSVFVWHEKTDKWQLFAEIRKSTNWRGQTFSVDFYPHWNLNFCEGKWCNTYFRDEADAEKFLLNNWEFFA